MIGAEPARAAQITFSAAYLEIEATYLVPADSKIRSVEEIDRKGVRIAVAARSAYDLYLSRRISVTGSGMSYCIMTRTFSEGFDRQAPTFSQRGKRQDLTPLPSH